MLLLSHLTYRCTDDSQKQSNIAAGYYGKYEKWGQCPQESGGILDTSVFSKDTLRIFFSHWGFLFASIVHTWVAGDRSKGSFNQEAQKGTGNSTEVFSISQLEWAEWLAQMLHTGANLCLSWEPWKLDFLCRGGGGQCGAVSCAGGLEFYSSRAQRSILLESAIKKVNVKVKLENHYDNVGEKRKKRGCLE